MTSYSQTLWFQQQDFWENLSSEAYLKVKRFFPSPESLELCICYNVMFHGQCEVLDIYWAHMFEDAARWDAEDEADPFTASSACSYSELVWIIQSFVQLQVLSRWRTF